MRRLFLSGLALALLGLSAFWLMTAPSTLSEEDLTGIVADPVRGEYVFRAAGCASCHMAKDAVEGDKLKLGGGQAFVSPFGTFHAPNISSDPDHGIGGWTPLQLVNAITQGTSPGGSHYYPALPYAAYTHMKLSDAVSLHAYLATLPAVSNPSLPHDLGFPFNIRRTLGGWKLLFLRRGWATQNIPPEAETGRYIAEALAHCSECHTPRNALGGLEKSRWMAGAPNPSGKGTIPNITPGRLAWTADDLVNYFQSGFTPEFDTAGGEMAEVISNLSTLPDSDLRSLAAYVKALPAVQ